MPASKKITYHGMTRTVADWAAMAGIKSATLTARLRRGFSLEQAIELGLGVSRRGTRQGDGCIRPDGYRVLWRDGAPILEHIAIAEAALGRRLPPEAEVHHVDLNRANNAPSNLVICPDHAYHALLHVRQAAMDATGDPNQRSCRYCGAYAPIDQMAKRAGNGKGRAETYVHLACERAVRNRFRARQRINQENPSVK